MRRIILIGAVVALAACGSTKSDVAVGGATDQTAASGNVAPATDVGATTASTISGSSDTINIDNFGDMPPKCIELFTGFLKKIEPEAAKVDWKTATIAQFQTFIGNFKAESDAFDAQSTAAGCDKYNLDATDKKVFDQIVKVAAAEAPGTVGFLTFIGAMSNASTSNTSSSSGNGPTDCAGTIAAIEPLMVGGRTTKDLTPDEVAKLDGLMAGILKNCTEQEQADFFNRPDALTFFATG
jgi:hypothetical protein